MNKPNNPNKLNQHKRLIELHKRLTELHEKIAHDNITLDELKEMEKLVNQKLKSDTKKTKILLILSRLLALLSIIIGTIDFVEERYSFFLFFLIVGIYNVYNGTQLKESMNKHTSSANRLLKGIDNYIKAQKSS